MRSSFPGLWLGSLVVAVAVTGSGIRLDPMQAQRQQPLAVASASAADTDDDAAPAYRQSLLTLHKALVECPSISGTEGDVGNWLIRYLTQHNYTAIKQPLPPRADTPPDVGRFNVLAWPGRGGGGDASKNDDDDDDDTVVVTHPRTLPRLLVTSHIDVVPPHIPYSSDAPLSEARRSTVLRGRGSVDDKASVAAQITALEELRRAGLAAAGAAADVMLLFVVGEEDSGDGMKAFSRYVQERFAPQGRVEDDGSDQGGDRGKASFEAVIFGEPTENKLACGHKGILNCVVTARGRAGHSGYPWLGKSANAVLVRGLVAALDTDLGRSARFGNTTLNIGRVEGGVAANVIAAEATAATGHEVVRQRLEQALHGVDAEALDLACGQGYGVVECNCAVDGFDTITVNYGTDVANLAGNHTRYLYGPGDILVAHSDHEALTVGDLETAVEGYKRLIQHVLGSKA
ncbi:acetylornithine deacetylase [Niveomyces insectorum RCEF 264]|uniref:Acetylornithine deacetylase n=1 Tax=Niveomyces insectorum RCEF 264 TaxID=1081102 RepID=A0A167UNU5_9HYPO|nr:acetylornithine deacetylase [Niveomyces insectorum RCEF 264]